MVPKRCPRDYKPHFGILLAKIFHGKLCFVGVGRKKRDIHRRSLSQTTTRAACNFHFPTSQFVYQSYRSPKYHVFCFTPPNHPLFHAYCPKPNTDALRKECVLPCPCGSTQYGHTHILLSQSKNILIIIYDGDVICETDLGICHL